MSNPEQPERCPSCASTDLARMRNDPPWCALCEWNLDSWPAPKRKRGSRAAVRARRRAFALNQRLLTELGGVLPERPAPTWTKTFLSCASIALLLFDVGLIGGGVYLIVAGAWWWLRVLAVLLIGIGIECRPRFHRLDVAHGAVTRAEMPEWWALVDEAATALSAPAIHTLALTDDFNAWCGRSGLRRRVVLAIGLPLWGALSPAGRQALLGHELGHLVNRDPTTAFTSQPALTTLGRLASIFDPRGLVSTGRSINALMAGLVAYPLLLPVSASCDFLHRILLQIGARDHQRVEAYADILAARLGGSAGVDELMRVLVLTEPVNTALQRAATQGAADPATWQAAVSQVLARSERSLLVTEQASLRYEASVYASHPPSGLRLRLTRSWPAAEPMRPIPVDQFTAADERAAIRYQRTQRALKNRPM